MDQLLAVFADGVACPRLTLPLFHTFIFLITSGHLDDVIVVSGRDGGDGDGRDVKSVLRSTWSLISRTGDPVKKITAGSLISSALRFKG